MNETSNQTGSWKSRPVFISSTFKDMHAERDWLRTRIFPRLEEELRRRHHHLELIDLRLGVETAKADTEEARELLVLKVCLDEIKRSRPFLLVVLGDRYGWVPPEDRIAAASREQGFETSPAGKSVTALEIEFGLLKNNPEQKQRSLFFFRQPLPYDQITEAQREIYSDAHSNDPQVRAGHSKLVELKNKLRKDPELGPRVFDYRLGWDAATGKVTGLEDFEKLVFDKLWAVIDEETRADESKVPPTWEEQERAAIAEFVEHRSRIFVGREEVMKQLLTIARSPTSEPKESTTWGACVVGSPGSGKSAVFAKLYRDLDTNDRGILLLANAAGGTQRGSSVDAMLRRWIVELSATAGTANPLPEKASPDDVEAAFYSLLRQVSAKRRVVVMLDALDQFEPTPRGRHLTWFKQPQWPANARIIATGLPCPAGEVLAQSVGIQEVELPQLTAADAAGIGKQVWGHYHREINPAVLRVLVEKKLPDGTPACGNPLWLTLALEQLNLLDADDFARAERDFTGSPTERMTALLLDTAKRMPPDIGGLYGWLLEQNEKAFGAANARGFAVAVALSRSGWRETDLLALVPRLAKILNPSSLILHNSSLDDLGLAALRRGFRAHIVRRGENGQLDFFHAQMRRAMLERCAPNEKTRQTLHAAISDYLETLPASDPLIRLERMGQLIGERNALRAGRYYATIAAYSGPTAERAGSTWTLVDWIAEGESGDKENPNLAWIISWLESASLTSDEVYRLTNNFQFGLFERMKNDLGLRARLQLVAAVSSSLQRLTANDPSNNGWQRNLSVCHNKIGYVLRAQGDLAGALKAFRDSLAIAQRLTDTNPTDAGWQDDISCGFSFIGDVLSAQGDPTGALNAFRDSLAIAQRLADADPANAHWQRNLSLCHNKIGDVLLTQGDLPGALKLFRDSLAIRIRLADADPANAEWPSEIVSSFSRIGMILRAQGDLTGALNAFRDYSLAIAQRLADADPANAEWQHVLSFSYDQIGEVLRSQGDLTGALNVFRDSLAIAQRLSDTDPANAEWQNELACRFDSIGEVLRTQGDSAGALKAFRDSLAIRERPADIADTERQADLSVSYGRIGDSLLDQGDLPGALKAFRDSLAILERLTAVNTSNIRWQLNLSVNNNRIGEVLSAQGDLAGALKTYREALAIMQHLATNNPSNTDCQYQIATSYDKIGDMLLNQRDLAGALKAFRETQTIIARLAEINPSNADWQHGLSISQGKIGRVLQDQNDSAGALKAFRENQSGLQRLTVNDPSNARLQRDLAVSYEDIGKVLRAQGDLTGAIKAHREAQTILVRLTAIDPSNARLQRDLSVNYDRIGEVLHAQGDLAGELKTQTIMQRRATNNPSNTDSQYDVSICCNAFGDMLLDRRDLAGALKSYRESVAILERLTATDPSNTRWQHDLWLNYRRIGRVLLDLDDLAEALKAFREAKTILARLAAVDPSNAEWQRDLSEIYSLIGNMLLDQGNSSEALKAYWEDLAIMQRLAANDPSNADCQRSLSVSYRQIGDVLLAQGDSAEALKTFRESVAIRERLATDDPSNAKRQLELYNIYIKLAQASASTKPLESFQWWSKCYEQVLSMKQREILDPVDLSMMMTGRDEARQIHEEIRGGLLELSQHDQAGALKAGRELLAIAQRLTVADPSDTWLQHDLSISYRTIGDVLLGTGEDDNTGDLAGAVNAHRESAAILERLTVSNPSKAEWQSDLFRQYLWIGTLLGFIDPSKSKYREWWRKCYEQILSMKQRGILATQHEQQLERARQEAGM